MEIESLSRSQSSLFLLLSPTPLICPSPSTFFTYTYEHLSRSLPPFLSVFPSVCLSRAFSTRVSKPYGVAMTTIVPLSLPPPPSLHLLAPLRCRHPLAPNSASARRTILSHRASDDYSAAGPRPLHHPSLAGSLTATRQTDAATPPSVPHLSNDLLLMLYQLTLQTDPPFPSLSTPCATLFLPSNTVTTVCLPRFPSFRLARRRCLPLLLSSSSHPELRLQPWRAPSFNAVYRRRGWVTFFSEA